MGIYWQYTRTIDFLTVGGVGIAESVGNKDGLNLIPMKSLQLPRQLFLVQYYYHYGIIAHLEW